MTALAGRAGDDVPDHSQRGTDRVAVPVRGKSPDIGKAIGKPRRREAEIVRAHGAPPASNRLRCHPSRQGRDGLVTRCPRRTPTSILAG